MGASYDAGMSSRWLLRGIYQSHSIKRASASAVLIPASPPMVARRLVPLANWNVPQLTAPAIALDAFGPQKHAPGQLIVPSSQAVAPLLSTWKLPAMAAGAQINRFQQARSPPGHQLRPPRQLFASSGSGGVAQGAASQVRPGAFGASAGELGGHGCWEQGVEPKAPPPPPPLLQSPVVKLELPTNSRVMSLPTSCPRPFTQIPPPPANPDPLK